MSTASSARTRRVDVPVPPRLDQPQQPAGLSPPRPAQPAVEKDRHERADGPVVAGRVSLEVLDVASRVGGPLRRQSAGLVTRPPSLVRACTFSWSRQHTLTNCRQAPASRRAPVSFPGTGRGPGEFDVVVAVHLHRCVDGRSQRPPRDGASAGASTAANSGEIVRQLLSRRVVRFATVSVAGVRASQVALAVTFGALGGRAMEAFDLKRASATVVVIVVSLGAFGSLGVPLLGARPSPVRSDHPDP